MSQPKPFEAHVGDRGRIVLPAELRRRARLKQGDRLLVFYEGEGRLRLTTVRAAVRRGLGMFADSSGHSAADDLLQERQADAALEEAEAAGDMAGAANARGELARVQSGRAGPGQKPPGRARASRRRR